MLSSNDKSVSNGDIVVSTLLFCLHTILGQSQSAWKVWHKYLCSVRHFELDEVFSIHDCGEVCKVLSNEFPALAVSVHWELIWWKTKLQRTWVAFTFTKCKYITCHVCNSHILNTLPTAVLFGFISWFRLLQIEKLQMIEMH